ncbi:MAG TPA: M56 family metallopeptidase [Clostridia bacterium]|nr:M56 family metallopeptidase [Clostridia bacterium]
MEQVFRELLNMTYTGSIVILAVFLLRFLLKSVKAPAWISCALWCAVFFRLVCPFSLESALALLPSTDPIPQNFLTAQTPEIYTGFAALNSFVNPAIAEGLTPAVPVASANPAQVWFFIGGVVWLAGTAAVLLSGAISAWKLRTSLRFAIRASDGMYESDRISTAFVWGVFRPRIYLPSGLDAQSRGHIALHEKTHMRRLDHIGKLLFFLAAAVHWFNPLAWFAFRLFEKDMELACDESVLAHAKSDIRKSYSETLLTVSAHKGFGLSPISFGETSVKSRIKNALSYKKPALWIVIGAVVIAAALGIALILNPPGARSGRLKAEGEPMEMYLSSVAIDEAQQYSYTVGHSVKSAVFYVTVYDPYLHPVELTEDWQTSSSATISPFSVINAAAVTVEGGKGLFAALFPMEEAVNVIMDPMDLAKTAKMGRTILDTPLPPPDSYASSISSILMEDSGARLSVEAERPVLLYARTFSQNTGMAPVSCEALMDDLTPIYKSDYAYMVYCMFSEKTADELEAEFTTAIQNAAYLEQAAAYRELSDAFGGYFEQTVNFMEGGEVVSSVPLEGNENALEVIGNIFFRQMVLSAAWPAEDMANYPDRIDIHVRFSSLFPTEENSEKDDEISVYHIFVKDGRPCFQPGDGMWTIMSDESYASILALKDAE